MVLNMKAKEVMAKKIIMLFLIQNQLKLLKNQKVEKKLNQLKVKKK